MYTPTFSVCAVDLPLCNLSSDAQNNFLSSFLTSKLLHLSLISHEHQNFSHECYFFIIILIGIIIYFELFLTIFLHYLLWTIIFEAHTLIALNIFTKTCLPVSSKFFFFLFSTLVSTFWEGMWGA